MNICQPVKNGNCVNSAACSYYVPSTQWRSIANASSVQFSSLGLYLILFSCSFFLVYALSYVDAEFLQSPVSREGVRATFVSPTKGNGGVHIDFLCDHNQQSVRIYDSLFP